MKYMDKVRVTKDRPEYAENNIHAGDVGRIWQPEIRENTFEVMFDTGDLFDWYKYCEVRVEDLEFVEEYGGITDEKLLAALPSPDPRWWCKVEDGYIINLKGERKNKIPYDYNS